MLKHEPLGQAEADFGLLDLKWIVSQIGYIWKCIFSPTTPKISPDQIKGLPLHFTLTHNRLIAHQRECNIHFREFGSVCPILPWFENTKNKIMSSVYCGKPLYATSRVHFFKGTTKANKGKRVQIKMNITSHNHTVQRLQIHLSWTAKGHQ
jgi:hypothetical protein